MTENSIKKKDRSKIGQPFWAHSLSMIGLDQWLYWFMGLSFCTPCFRNVQCRKWQNWP